MLDKDQVEASSRLSREEALEFLESYQKLVAGLSKEGLPQDMVIQLPDDMLQAFRRRAWDSAQMTPEELLLKWILNFIKTD